MSILVTGASGFIGRRVLERLRGQDAEVFALSSKPQADGDGVRWVQADFLHDDLTPILERIRPRRVIHMAWECGRYDHVSHLDWLRASLRWLDALKASGCEHLLTIGSSMEYRWTATPCHEFEGIFDPATPYGECKYALGRLCAAYGARCGIKHAHARIFFVCGVGEAKTRLIPGAIQAISEGREFICKAGIAWRDYLDVEDVAALLAEVSARELEGPYNIASGSAVRLGDMMQLLAEKLGRPDLLQLQGPPAEGAKDIALANVERLRAAIGELPAFVPSASIDRMIAWMQDKETVRGSR